MPEGPLRLPALTHADRRRIAVELHIAAGGYYDAGMGEVAHELHRLGDKVYPGKRDVPEGTESVRVQDLPMRAEFRLPKDA